MTQIKRSPEQSWSSAHSDQRDPRLLGEIIQNLGLLPLPESINGTLSDEPAQEVVHAPQIEQSPQESQ